LRPSAASEASAISCFGIVVTDVIEISLPNVKTAVFSLDLRRRALLC